MTDKFEKIKELKQLLDDGLIDDQEYSQLKKELLQDNDNNQESSNKNKVPKCLKPFYWIEKRVLEPTENTINRLAIFSILERLGALAIVIGVLSFALGGQERRNNDVFTAWQTITNAQDQGGSGGRIKALEFLNSRPWRFPWIGWTKKRWYWNGEECERKRLWGLRWQREHLAGLSAPDAFLHGVHLCGANLNEANLQGAILSGAKLQRTNLNEAKLQGAIFTRAKLQGAYLEYANLQNAELWHANFREANFREANLQNTKLGEANLQGAILSGAKLQGAYFRLAKLQGAYLEYANLTGAVLQAKNLSNSQIKSACFWRDAIYVEAKFNETKDTWVTQNEQKNQERIKEIKQAETSNASTPDECRERWKNN